MTTFVSLAETSREAGRFYVPQFQIRIEGANLPQNVLRDVCTFTYRDDVEKIDSFELTVNNWDDEVGAFKYIGSETAGDLQPSSSKSARYKLFEPCNKQVDVWLGYSGYMRKVTTGRFLSIEPNFPSAGQPNLTVRGLNALHGLRTKPYTTGWTGKTDSQIALELPTLMDGNKKRFPWQIRVDDKAAAAESPTDIVIQDNQTDIEFLLSRARRRGYVVAVEPADDPKKERLYFGPSDSHEPPKNFRLAWGATLLEFKPTLTTANQFKSVTVRFWDRRTRRLIKKTATVEDNPLNTDLRELLTKCDPREEHVVDRPVFSAGEAGELARSILLDRQRTLVKASGATVGLPDLRAGSQVQITGVGARLSGTYFVTETTHTVDDGGYVTRFTARREEQ